MLAEVIPISDAVLRRALVGLRRQARLSVLGTIEDTETALAQVASDMFPVCRPRRRAQEFDMSGLLCDPRGRSMTFQGARVMRPKSLARIDDLLDWLRRNWGPENARPEVLLGKLGNLLWTAQSLRARGGYYGLISNGVSGSLACYAVGEGRETDRVFAQDGLELAVQSLRAALERSLRGCDDDEEYIDAMRAVFSMLANSGDCSDVELASLVTGSEEIFEVVDIVIRCSPWLPRRAGNFASWRAFVADVLRVIPNEDVMAGSQGRAGVSARRGDVPALAA